MPHDTAPFAFFSNADDPHLASWYGPPVKRAFLSAVLKADWRRECTFRTYWGDLLFPFTNRIARSTAFAYAGENARSAKSRTISATQFSDDFALRYAMLCQLADVAAARWHTIDPVHMPWTLYSQRVYVGVASAMPIAIRSEVDGSLNRLSWYLGAMEVDVNDPLQIRLFGETLVPLWFYRKGWVGTEQEDDRQPVDVLFEGIDAEGYGWENALPQLVSPSEVEWGKIADLDSDRTSMKLVRAADKRGHNEHIIAAVHQLPMQTELERDISFDVSHPKPDADDLRRKLCDYVLDPEKSGGKAEFFRRELAIEKEDWRLLAIQLTHALRRAKPRQLRGRPFGERHHLQYEVTVRVVGRNGEAKPIKAAWKIVDERPPELITAFPGSINALDSARVRSVVVVGYRLGTDAYYSALFETASSYAAEAMEECIPTPFGVTLDSGEVSIVPTGEFGGAWVKLPDARRGFARWLLRAGLAGAAHPGAKIHAPGHSADKARAWADAFSEVLRANGDDCETGYYLD